MYNRDDSYHEQKAIDVTNMDAEFLYRYHDTETGSMAYHGGENRAPTRAMEGLKNPSRVNDRSKIPEIEAKSVAEIEARKAAGERHSLNDEGYNTTGVHWALREGLLERKDQAIFWRTIAEIRKLGYNGPKTLAGEYVIEAENKLLFTDADFKAPTLTRVVVFNDDSEDNMALAKELIFDEESQNGGHNVAQRVIEAVYGVGYAAEYDRGDYVTDVKQAQRGKGTNRARRTGKVESRKSPRINAQASEESGAFISPEADQSRWSLNLDDYTIDEILKWSDKDFERAYDALGGIDDDILLEDDFDFEDVAEELDEAPEKIEILYRRKGLGDSHVAADRMAVMTEKRIDERIHDSGAKGHPDYARRYITRIARKRNEEPRQASGWRHI